MGFAFSYLTMNSKFEMQAYDISDEGVDLIIWIQATGGDKFFEVRNEKRLFFDIGGFGNFMDGEFREGIVRRKVWLWRYQLQIAFTDYIFF